MHTFTNPEVFKTDAPSKILVEILKYYKLKEVGKDNLFKNVEENSIGHKLLSIDVTVEPKFDLDI